MFPPLLFSDQKKTETDKIPGKRVRNLEQQDNIVQKFTAK